MATLEKIRSKSVLLLVIIGIALLAFIVGDFLTSGRTLFGNPTTVAKVDGRSIDINDYSRRLEQANSQLQQQDRKVDPAVLRQQVLSQMITEQLVQDEMEALGLKVSADELTDIMLGENSYYVDAYVRQTYGLEGASQLYDIAYNPAKYGINAQDAAQYQALWNEMEHQFEQMLLQQKLTTLFNGAITANDLDAKAAYDENASTSRIAYVKKDYSTVEDGSVETTDRDLNDWWARHKEMYRVHEQQRSITYIAMPILPSNADLTAGSSRAELAYEALAEQPGLEGMDEFVDFIVTRQSTPISGVSDRQVRNFLDSAKVGSAAMVKKVGYDYTLAKLLDRSTQVDSVNVDFAAITGTSEDINAMIDSLNAGTKTWASLDSASNVQAAQADQWISLTDPAMATLRAELDGVTTGRYFTPDTAITQGARIIRINERKSPVQVLDYAVVTYTIEPSRATINGLETALRTYAAENNTPETFYANAAAAGFTATPWQVSASVPQINNMPDTHGAVQWAMEAKKGQISPVFGDETTGNFIAVCVNDIYDNFVPARDMMIESGIRAQVLNEKKGDMLAEQFAGKADNLAGYAELMGVSVDTTNVTFGQPVIAGIGYNDGAVMGATAALAPGQLSDVLKGNSAVVVLQVLDVDNNPARPYTYSEGAASYSRNRGAAALQNNLPIIIQNNKKVENRINKFYRD